MKGNHNTWTVTSKKVGIPPTNFKKHFEDTKEVIRIRISKTHRQYNGQEKRILENK
jgi:hypothetical protein